jgi:cytochrome c biogenesis protein CcdA
MSPESSRVAERRVRFREAVARLGERAQSTELLRMLLLPGAFALVAGFVFMFLGWYGASRTARQIEQVPYLISGGFIGLGLVFVGALLLASAFWMSMLQRFSEQANEREEERARQLEQRLRQELGGSRPSTSRRSTSRRP